MTLVASAAISKSERLGVKGVIRILKNSELSSLFLLVLGICTLSACWQAPMERQAVFSGPIMGTEYRISLIHGNDADLEDLEKQLIDSMEEVNQSMSHYLPDSEVSQFNRSGADQPIAISQQFFEVMTEALSISELSKGAFDITLGKAVNLWGFGPDGRITEQPSDAALERLIAHTGHQKLSLTAGQLSKSHDEVSIDLSAIAKGYAVDRVAELLLGLGYERYLIDIGGELRASGLSLDNRYWRVGIEKPHILGGIQEVAELQNQAIATSGDYRNYHIIDGQHFSHTIDPMSLRPVFHKLALVSVISERTSTADALATAMMAMGEERATRFAQEQELAAYLLIRDSEAGSFKTVVTHKFKQYLQ